MKLFIQLSCTLTLVLYIGTVWAGLAGGVLVALFTLRAFMEGMNA